MKKCLAIFLVICLFAMAFAGCGKSEQKPSESESAFVAPDNYVSIVQITINPIVNLYLDKSDVVLAVEYVNEDAKECYSKVESEIVGQKLEIAVDKVVKSANGDGYFEENKTLTIDIVESKLPEKKALVLTATHAYVELSMAANSISAEVKFSERAQQAVNESSKAELQEPGMAPGNGGGSASQGSSAAPSDGVGNVTSNNAGGSTGVGAGSPGGTANGSAGEAKPTYKLMKNIKYEIFKLGETDELITGIHITFKDDGSYSYAQVPYLNDPFGEGEYRIYKGNKYYVSGGGGGGGNYTVKDNKIVMSGGLELELTLIENDKLRVDKVTGGDFFKAGDVIQIFSNSHEIEVVK